MNICRKWRASHCTANPSERPTRTCQVGPDRQQRQSFHADMSVPSCCSSVSTRDWRAGTRLHAYLRAHAHVNTQQMSSESLEKNSGHTTERGHAWMHAAFLCRSLCAHRYFVFAAHELSEEQNHQGMPLPGHFVCMHAARLCGSLKRHEYAVHRCSKGS